MEGIVRDKKKLSFRFCWYDCGTVNHYLKYDCETNVQQFKVVFVMT